MSVIMAHAPIVIPALAGLAFPFSKILWIPLIERQATVAMRVVGGLSGLWELRRWSAMLNAFVLALFVSMVVATVVRGQLQKRHRGVAAA